MKTIILSALLLIFAHAANYAQSPGSLDPAFVPPGTGPNSVVEAIAVQSDGKILIGGSFSEYNGTSVNGIARLEADGSLDPTFNAGAGVQGIVAGQQYHVYDIAIQSDGKIIIAGAFNYFDGNEANDIARLNTDGSHDNSFNTGSGTGDGNEVINSVVIQNDGKVLIAGSFDNFGGLSGVNVTNKIARLNSDGSVDATFDEGDGSDAPISDLAVQTDGKIVIVGNFTEYNGTSRNKVARLNSDGTLDAGFDPGSGSGGTFPNVRAAQIQSDGKIVVAGYFDSFDGTSRKKIARLNADGSLDNSLDPGDGADLNSIHKIAIQADGAIIIAGSFNNYDGTSRNSIARIQEDGSLDTQFDPGTGCDNTAEALALQSDGKILIGGNFTTYNGTPREQIARIHAGVATGARKHTSEMSMNVFPNPSRDFVSITNIPDHSTLSMTNAGGQVVFNRSLASGSALIPLKDYEPGVYFLNIRYEGGIFAKRLIIDK